MALVEINWHPSRRELRQFAGIWFPLLGALVGWVVLRKTGSWSAAVTIWAVTAVVSAVGVLAPGVMRPIFVGWMALTYPIGWTVSHLVLGIAYFGVLTPIAAVMRLAGRDALRRKPEPSATSFWTAHDPGASADRYFRQY
jgi:Saxitoxin biosynthesis operon protein SxtJ